MKVFYGMAFTGKTFDEIVKERQELQKKAKLYKLDLVEQFIGVEEKSKFEAHSYGPLFIAEKDHALLKKADLVIADYSEHSIGRDCEIVISKEVFDKRVISVVPDEHMKNHPWVRLYSDYIVSTREEAFILAKELSKLSLSPQLSTLTRQQKDLVDEEIADLLEKQGLSQVIELLPTELKRRWQALFGKEVEEVIKSSFQSLPKTIRVNTLKTTASKFLEIAKLYSWQLQPLSFTKNAFRLPPEVKLYFGDIPEHEAGLFYVQELASMLPVIALNPKPGEKVLDIAAAPGSKTTQMAELMKNKGSILANDISEERMQILKKAVTRLGITIIDYHLGDASALGDIYPETFDKVLVDAPCSTEGILRYKAHKFLEWSLLLIYRITKVQKQLIESGFKALKPGGTMVYSTCAFSPEENEAIVNSLIKKYSTARIEQIEFKGVKTRKGLVNWEHLDLNAELARAVRIYPQDNDSIGFFIAKIAKKNSK